MVPRGARRGRPIDPRHVPRRDDVRPGLPIEDAGWEDDEDHPRSARELVGAFETTWALIDGCLRRWTADDLAVEFTRTYGRRQSASRGWVIWHLIEHELLHGTEIALILRSNGLPTLEV